MCPQKALKEEAVQFQRREPASGRTTGHSTAGSWSRHWQEEARNDGWSGTVFLSFQAGYPAKDALQTPEAAGIAIETTLPEANAVFWFPTCLNPSLNPFPSRRLSLKTRLKSLPYMAQTQRCWPTPWPNIHALRSR